MVKHRHPPTPAMAPAPLRAEPAGGGLPPRTGRAAGEELRGLSAPASGRRAEHDSKVGSFVVV
jgi:hypothetical protein